MRLIDFLLVALVAAAGLATSQVFRAADVTGEGAPRGAGALPTAGPIPRSPLRTPSGVTANAPGAPAWRFIVIHHSGTRRGSAAVFSRARGGPETLPYHYVIGNGTDSGDGEVELTARGLYQCPGPQCGSPEIDRWALGICLVGNFDLEAPSRRQVDAVITLARRLAKAHSIPAGNVVGERELAPDRSSCPGKRFPLDAVRRTLAQ
ncbi:MAG: N-acetylmuramoyl-L-alanine amidase [Planctomycetes bacterium]|nr:N-acetylmuramoyl-L-alanine amidase [Planctomycetota bacterium]